jgi:hypothetical protein
MDDEQVRTAPCERLPHLPEAIAQVRDHGPSLSNPPTRGDVVGGADIDLPPRRWIRVASVIALELSLEFSPTPPTYATASPQSSSAPTRMSSFAAGRARPEQQPRNRLHVGVVGYARGLQTGDSSRGRRTTGRWCAAAIGQHVGASGDALAAPLAPAQATPRCSDPRRRPTQPSRSSWRLSSGPRDFRCALATGLNRTGRGGRTAASSSTSYGDIVSIPEWQEDGQV